MIKRVLITGAAGFFASEVCRHVASFDEELELICTDIIKSDDTCCKEFICADLSCLVTAEDLVKQISPDCIIHLAGTFGTADNQEIYRINVLSTATLLEAASKYVPDVVFLTAGSAAEYGRVSESQLPVDERLACNPITVYGLSKLLATKIALYYHRAYNICTMVIRPFQLIGKGVTAKLAPGAFAQQLRQADEGQKVIKVGNLESSRDFLDVSDAAEAVWVLCQKPACGEVFNLCSGKPTKMSELLQEMINQCGVDIKVEIDHARLRVNTDAPVVYGSYEKLRKHCGWQPKRTLPQSLRTMFE
jgi:GDP-4-dehydro-6-deoxy-D-mannose reductase